MNVIDIKCHTNLDDYNCPIRHMACPPRLGDKVEVLYKGNRQSLTIVSITHCVETERLPMETYLLPYLKIELHR